MFENDKSSKSSFSFTLTLKLKMINRTKTEVKTTVAKAPEAKTKTKAPSKTIISPKTTKDFKAPPKTSSLLAPPPKVRKEDEQKDGLLASPWFWTGVSVALVAGATTGAVLLLDSSSDTQNFQSRVEW